MQAKKETKKRGRPSKRVAKVAAEKVVMKKLTKTIKVPKGYRVAQIEVELVK